MSNTEQNVNDDIDAAVKEAFKVLRANIKFFGQKGKVKTLTITSTKMGEGKTTVSTNLAAAMAETGMKVLYIDADLRKASTLKHLKGETKCGLSNLLSEGTPLDEVILPTQTENLFCIASGPKPPNPTELVGSSEFSGLLKMVSEGFDIIIIDTPPLGTMIDAAVIAERTDGTIIIAGAKETDLRSMKRVREQLGKANVRILGAVLNKVAKRDFESYYGYYHYNNKERTSKKGWLGKLNILRKVSL